MSKTVGKILTVAAVVVSVAAAAVTAGASIGISAAILGAASAGIAAATFINNAALAAKAKEQLQQRQASVVALQLGEVSREALLGEAVTGGSLADAFNYGGKNGTDWECLIIALADHLCDALLGFYVNDQYVAYAGDGPVAGYNGQLEVYWRPGSATQTVPPVVLTNGPGWTPADIGAGVCWVAVCYKADAADAKKPIWTAGRPRFRWRLRGARCYQARKDSSIGGTGAHRRDDPSTWEWTDNPIDCRYAWVRGIYACDRIGEPGQLLVGRGLSAIEAPPANVFSPANICDELVALDAGGSEKRYRVNGVIRADETFISVEEHFAAACAGIIVQPEGAVEIEPGHAKAPVFFFSDDDLLVGSTVQFSDELSDADESWVNTVSPRYIEPTQGYVDHAAPVRRLVDDITADGGPREQSLSLAMVTSGTQAGRVGEIARRFGRLPRRASVTLGPPFAEVEEGDWGVWTSTRYLKGKSVLFRVESYGLDERWHNTLVLREISATVYAKDADAASTSVALRQEDLSPVPRPGPDAWTLIGGQVASGDTAVPALVIEGATDTDYAELVRFEILRADGVTDPATAPGWVEDGTAGPDVRRRVITAVAPKTKYYAAISYMLGRRPGPRRIAGPVTTGDAMLPWDSLSDPNDTKPDNNATNSADPNSAFGPDGTVGGTIEKLSDFEAAVAEANRRSNVLENETLPAINGAVEEADRRIAAAREVVDRAVQDFAEEVARAKSVDEDLARQIKSIVAEGGYDDSAVRALIERAETARASGDRGLGERIDRVITAYEALDVATNARVTETAATLSRADLALGQRIDSVQATFTKGTTPNGDFSAQGARWDALDFGFPSYGGGFLASSTPGVYAQLNTQGLVKLVDPNRGFRLHCVFRIYAAMQVAYCGLQIFDAAGNHLGNIYSDNVCGLLAPGAYVVDQLYQGVNALLGNPAYGSGGKFPPGAHSVRPLFLANYPAAGGPFAGSYVQIESLWLEDVGAAQQVDTKFEQKVTALAEADRGFAERATLLEASASAASGTLNAPATGVLARLSGHDATLADLPNRYAAAQRVATLESQVNFAADSGLQRTINARIEDRASAIADAKTGAVVQTVNNLRAEYDGTAATVGRQAGAIVDLQGKAAAYVRLNADAGNGYAQLSLWADQYGGAWELAGNGRIRGNLLIDGTFTARKIDRTSVLRESSSVFTGFISPTPGQTLTVPWSLSLTQIPPLGRFLYEYTFGLATNAGQRDVTNLNGRPAYTDYVEDGGGLSVVARDQQGNVYAAAPNSSNTVLATTDFVPSWSATVRKGSRDTGWMNEGDYYRREVAATYTLSFISLKVTWVAI